jgi:hypothetical protein
MNIEIAACLPLFLVFFVAKGGNILTIKCPVTIIQRTVKQERVCKK